MMTIPFPVLYKKTSVGKIQSWEICVEGATIITTYGQVGGKMQTAYDTIKEGKNIGKSNETTPEQQAVLEATSQWEKKQKKNYTTKIEDAEAGKVDETFVVGGLDPMLAHVFTKQGHKIKYPAFVQPKLDGHRCIAIVGGDTVTLWSRTRKPILGVPHIIRAIEDLQLPDGTILDGELYNHNYRDRFEDLTSFIKRPEPKAGHEVVQYHIYDTIMDAPCNQRLSWVGTWLVLADHNVLCGVYTRVVDNEEELMEAFAYDRSKGYEGTMVRNYDSPYVGKRSYDLQKVKEFDDAEFMLVDIEEGRGKMAGKAVFICDNGNGSGDTFKCKLVGNLDDLSKYLQNKEEYIGKTVTVQFQGFTSSDMPRFPVALRFRKDV